MESKRLLALSDSHGHISALKTVLRWAGDNGVIDAAVFLGDGIQDLCRVNDVSF